MIALGAASLFRKMNFLLLSYAKLVMPKKEAKVKNAFKRWFFEIFDGV